MRCTDRCVFTAWTTVREVLPGAIIVVTLQRSCCLCGYVEDARRDVQEVVVK